MCLFSEVPIVIFGGVREITMLVFVNESGDSGFETSDPILCGNAGDKRHSSGRKHFQYYVMANNRFCQTEFIVMGKPSITVRQNTPLHPSQEGNIRKRPIQGTSLIPSFPSKKRG